MALAVYFLCFWAVFALLSLSVDRTLFKGRKNITKTLLIGIGGHVLFFALVFAAMFIKV
jgi:hypothetical protein